MDNLRGLTSKYASVTTFKEGVIPALGNTHSILKRIQLI